MLGRKHFTFEKKVEDTRIRRLTKRLSTVNLCKAEPCEPPAMLLSQLAELAGVPDPALPLSACRHWNKP